MLDALIIATLAERVHHELSKALDITHNPTRSDSSQDPLPAGQIVIIEDLLISRGFRDFRAIGHNIKSKDRRVKKKCENPLSTVQRTSGFEARCYARIWVFCRASNPPRWFASLFDPY